MEDLTGRQFGHYQIVAPLGEGGMASVYKAYQPSMERHVAIKVLPRHMASSEEFLTRFRREAKLLAHLQHPNILPVFDYGESDSYPYIVMPFIPSGTLADLLNGQRLQLAKVRRVMTQIGDALAYAHARGMIHRDIKPSNVLMDESGNCLLTDFGLARMVESSSKVTSTGTVLGTPAYMSPEQGTGSEIDHRSDIYSLGIILYEAVTGRVPYNAETPIAIVFKHIQDPLPSARKLNPDLPESVELILLKALAKNPSDRYQNMEGFVQAIQMAISETTPLESLPTQKPKESVPTVIEAGPRKKKGEEAPRLVSEQETIAKPVEDSAPSKASARKSSRPKLIWNIGKRVLTIAIVLGGILFLLNSGINFAKSMGVLATELPPVTYSSKIKNLDTSTSSHITDATGNFQKGQNVYLRFDMNDVRSGTTFETKWYYSVDVFGKKVYFLFTSLVYTSKGSEANIHFFLNKPETAGNYEVDVYMDGNLVGRRAFSIK